MHRFYVPGARAVFGRFVTLTTKPGAYEDGGTLAEPTVIRAVAIPAGAGLYVDCDFGHIDVHLREPLRVRGVELRAGDVLHFPNRFCLPMYFSVWLLPLLPLVMLFLYVQSRREARRIWVMRDQKYIFAIRPDGETEPI